MKRLPILLPLCLFAAAVLLPGAGAAARGRVRCFM